MREELPDSVHKCNKQICWKALDLGKSQFIDHYAPDVAEMFVNAGKI